MLVGTSLIVIIPEGVETLYSAHRNANIAQGAKTPHSPRHDDPAGNANNWANLRHRQDGQGEFTVEKRDISRGVVAMVANLEQREPSSIQGSAETHSKLNSLSERDSTMAAIVVQRRDPVPPADDHKREPVNPPAARDDHKHDEEHESSPHAWVGLALIAGYLLMYLIDTLPALAQPLSRPRALHISLSNLSQGLHHDPSSPPGSPSLHAASSAVKHTPATTIGLVIHAIADGIALGASTASAAARSSLGLVVFLAIMLHKAPAAFGLTSVLLKQGLSKREARAHLLLFSLAAPFGALTTWALVNLVGNGGKAEGESELWWTGVVLVFSGGTFL